MMKLAMLLSFYCGTRTWTCTRLLQKVLDLASDSEMALAGFDRSLSIVVLWQPAAYTRILNAEEQFSDGV